MRTTLLTVLNYAAIAFGLVSAFLWMRSASVTVSSSRADGQYVDGTVVDGGNDFYATAREQARWNRWAAATAALAALAQTAANFIK